jgi:ketosteroid isomerase-like protein
VQPEERKMTMVRRGWKAGSFAVLVMAATLPALAVACEPGHVVAEVAGADAERYKAMENGDLPTLARYLADDLIYTHSSAVVDSKETYIDSLRSGKVVYKQTRRSDLRVSPYGCTAVMTGRGDFSVTIDGKGVEVQLRFTNVWVKNPEGWQMVAWEATRIPPKP